MRDTSLTAYRAIVAGGLLSRRRSEVYTKLYWDGPLTGAELDARFNGQGRRGHRHKRLPELRDLGVVKETGLRICTVTGRRAIAWDVTSALPTRTEPTPEQTIERCRNRIARHYRAIERLREEEARAIKRMRGQLTLDRLVEMV